MRTKYIWNIQYLRAIDVIWREHLIIIGSFWANVATLYDINWPKKQFFVLWNKIRPKYFLYYTIIFSFCKVFLLFWWNFNEVNIGLEYFIVLQYRRVSAALAWRGIYNLTFSCKCLSNSKYMYLDSKLCIFKIITFNVISSL